MAGDSPIACRVTYSRGPRGQIGIPPTVFPDEEFRVKGGGAAPQSAVRRSTKSCTKFQLFFLPFLAFMLFMASFNFHIQLSSFSDTSYVDESKVKHNAKGTATCKHQCQSLLLVGSSIHRGIHKTHKKRGTHSVQTPELRQKVIQTCTQWCASIEEYEHFVAQDECTSCPSYSIEFEFLNSPARLSSQCRNTIQDLQVLLQQLKPKSQELSPATIQCAQHNFLTRQDLYCDAVSCNEAPHSPGKYRDVGWRQEHESTGNDQGDNLLQRKAENNIMVDNIPVTKDGYRAEEFIVTEQHDTPHEDPMVVLDSGTASGGREFKSSTDEPLIRPLEKYLVLWLKADEGVHVDHNENVVKWVDQSPWTPHYEFTPTSESSHVHDIFGHVNHESENGEPVLKRSGWTMEQNSKPKSNEYSPLPVVQFPCALENNELQLHDMMTIFIVLEVERFAYGRYAKGQRFFGHYPNGQFRFLDGAPDMFVDLDFPLEHLQAPEASILRGKLILDKSLPIGVSALSDAGMEDGKLHSRTPILLKYRFSHDVEIGVNQGEFFQTKSTSSTELLFSQDSKLTVGGVRGGCEFEGRIAEIMVYDEVLNDESSQDVTSYLIEKWFPTNLRPENVDHEAHRMHVPVAAIAHAVHAEDSSAKSVLEFSSFSATNPLSLWLKADRGVEFDTDGTVSRWQAQSPGRPVSFVPAHTSSVVGHDGPTAPTLVHVESSSFPVVRFQCAMEAVGVQLEVPSTIFIVLSVNVLSSSINNKDQRFFGHFPNGGMQFLDGRPVFTTSSTDWGKQRVSIARWPQVPQNQLVILKYAITSNKVTVELNGGKKTTVAHDGDVRFSRNGKLTVGGTNSGCGFQGDIAEIMVFQNEMKQRASVRIYNHLNAKYGIHKLPEESAGTNEVNDSPTLSNDLENIPTTVDKTGYIGSQLRVTPKTSKLKCPDFEFTQDILEWKPPRTALPEMKMEWEDVVATTRQEIAEFQHGGKELHKFLRTKIKELNRKRSGLFHGICDDLSTSEQKVSSVSFAPVLQHTAGSRRSPVAQVAKSKNVNDGGRVIDCGSADVYDWVPPSTPLIKPELRMDWEDYQNSVHESIVGYQQGGKALKKFIRGKIREMLGERRKMFGKICASL